MFRDDRVDGSGDLLVRVLAANGLEVLALHLGEHGVKAARRRPQVFFGEATVVRGRRRPLDA